MKKALLLIFTLLLATVTLVGCGDTNLTANRDTVNDVFNAMGTLQGTIFDATTGVRLGGTDLKIYLIQGTTTRTPDRLITDTTDPLVGEYAISNVPVTVDGNADYKIVVINTGYQRFEGEFDMDANYGNIIQNDGSSPTLDGTYNFIGNIYLFPIGAQAGDVTIYVENPLNKRVSGATVVMEQNIGSNSATTGTSSNRIFATNGLLASLSGTTDSSGAVTFAGSTLALGASYTPKALPLTFETQQLKLTTGTEIVVGTGNAQQRIQMADLNAGGLADGLYVVYATNYVTGSYTGITPVTSAGVLTITYNRPVEIIDEAQFTATLVNPGAAVLSGAGTAASVNATLSTDKLTLTLTPVFSTNPVATDVGLTVRYAVTGTVRDASTYTAYTVLSTDNTLSGSEIPELDGTPVIQDVRVNP